MLNTSVELRLLRHLTDGYNPAVRPVRNHRNTVTVSIAFNLASIDFLVGSSRLLDWVQEAICLMW